MVRRYRILSLDGGGVRGVISALWLRELERLLPGNLRQHFDLIAGTSTGSILACGIACGLSADELLRLYFQDGQTVFPATVPRFWDRLRRTITQGLSAPKYSGEGLARVLKTRLGQRSFGSVPVLTLVVAYDVLNRRAAVLKSSKPIHRELPLWQVCKASSSAPTYFPAEIVQIDGALLPLVDGGVVANNPTACAIAEAARVSAADNGAGIKDLVVASFGTGEVMRPIAASHTQEWGAIEWAVPLINVLLDGSTEATDYIARHLIPHANYFRFQTTLPNGFETLDDATDGNLNALCGFAMNYLNHQNGRTQLERLAALLQCTSTSEHRTLPSEFSQEERNASPDTSHK